MSWELKPRFECVEIEHDAGDDAAGEDGERKQKRKRGKQPGSRLRGAKKKARAAHDQSNDA